VTERQSGLRFDIYERVHLADNTVGIKELDEIELVPHIQVFSEGEQAILKGNLYLTGKYEGETGGESRTLEHFIPVEITLPLNRIHDLQQVSVDIDNFDVDVLSSRSLNVTGVLSLEGIEMISAPDNGWLEEEETVFVHEASRASEQEQEQEQEPESEPATEPRSGEQGALTGAAEASEEASADVPASQEDEVHEVVALDTASSESPEDVPVLAAEAQEEKKEPKVVFGSKSSEQAYHLKSMIHTGARNVGQQVEEAPAKGSRGDSVEWTKLFVRSEEEGRQFRRVKMVIVQKQDSIDSIAQRYNVNAREILLYNRLNDQDVAEGQVLYIPKA